ncbi:hypothetical protein V8E51_014379 [Hyaloscypha variabilis]
MRDSYQGEENDIILLSLVRGTPSNNIGFLDCKKHLVVTRPRARHSLYRGKPSPVPSCDHFRALSTSDSAKSTGKRGRSDSDDTDESPTKKAKLRAKMVATPKGKQVMKPYNDSGFNDNMDDDIQEDAEDA